MRHAMADVGGNANLARSWARLARELPRAARREVLDLLPRLDFPVLLLWADEDRRHPLRGAEEALDLLPDAILRVLPRHRLPDRLRRPGRRRARADRVLRLAVALAASVVGFEAMPPVKKKTLYGGETKKAVDNFPISGETVPLSVIHWLGRIKGAAAPVNAELGNLDTKLAAEIAAAGAAIAAGEHDDQFPIDVFQTGSGTSSNMNANEVISALTGGSAHPNDHVNFGQSSNDVFPSAVHLAALDQATNTLLPALKQLERSFDAQGQASSRTSSSPAART